VEIPCSEKSAKSETSNFGLRFFEMLLQKNVKSFGIFKKCKIRILELWPTYFCAEEMGQKKGNQ